MNVVSVCGCMFVKRMYRYDGTSFHKLDSVECAGVPILCFNIIKRGYDHFISKPEKAWVICLPMLRVCNVYLEPSGTYWLASRELLPEELQQKVPSPPRPLLLTIVCTILTAILPKSLLILLALAVEVFPWRLCQNLVVLGVALSMGVYWSNSL